MRYQPCPGPPRSRVDVLLQPLRLEELRLDRCHVLAVERGMVHLAQHLRADRVHDHQALAAFERAPHPLAGHLLVRAGVEPRPAAERIRAGIEATRVVAERTREEVPDGVVGAAGPMRQLAAGERVCDARRAECSTRDDPTAEPEVCELMAVRVGEAEDLGVGMCPDDHLRGCRRLRHGRAVDGDDGVELAHECRQPVVLERRISDRRHQRRVARQGF